MLRIVPVGAIVFTCLGSVLSLSGQTPDSTSLGAAQKEIALLKRIVADQERRLAALERTVRPFQAAALAASRRVPTIPWRTPEAWAAVKMGMSRAQVVEILGEPKLADSVMDRVTLFYKEVNDPVGNVVITDDRVSELAAPRFEIFLPLQK